ncbi:glycosyltransferase family 58 protein [Punctularia strigosozonata HHB-11173 SS5]|uniref:glycosyltransferase family 58 protein n=1 Tax=Punctularia strigosozonata (strain HHB-11173) TaxID=741275 RepID=UPI0004417E5E|nr:glycosyltransferase family 58 protein [Punctularia strigosozonata HHB-11173 SS5]EIN07449.1 glycosyltransferase family 58 protein [Punctularia strigosozonata HHB-11173 SS5]
MNALQHFRLLLIRLLTNPSYFWALAGLVILGDAILTQLIIRFIPYTEIDWETYMHQISLYIKGERNYRLLEGPTGPLVYPAGHVAIHRWLHNVTSSGEDVPRAQQVYGALYLLSLALACATYSVTGVIPNWLVMLLPLSKRLHSLYVLRLFNDCWMAVAAQAAVLAYATGADVVGTLMLSLAISTKMSALLYLPGLLVVLFRKRGLVQTALHLTAIVAIQAWLAADFLRADSEAYFHGAFDFSRVFLYKWTVNWRFLDEQTFLDPRFAKALLLCHISTLAVFGWRRWCSEDGGVLPVLGRAFKRPTQSPALGPILSDDVVTILYTSNLIGILFARSLHYQFYSWYAQQLPFLVWRTQYPALIKVFLLFGIEYSWNVFPSTTFSSLTLCIANALVVFGIYLGSAMRSDRLIRTNVEVASS